MWDLLRDLLLGGEKEKRKHPRTKLDSNPQPLGFKQHCVQLILMAGVRFLCFNNVGFVLSKFF